MEKEKPESLREGEEIEPSASTEAGKAWEEPKLAFVEPKLSKHGKLEKITRDPHGFFGPFSP